MTSLQEVQLSDDLHQIVAGQPFAPDVEAIERRGRQRRRRSMALRGGAGLGVALVAGAVIAAQSGVMGGTAARPQSAPAKPQAETAAYVTAHVVAALGQASNYMIRTIQQGSPGGAISELTDPRTGSSYLVQGSGAGTHLGWESTFYVANVLHWRDTEADYGSRTWFTYVFRAAGPIQGPPPSGPSVPGGSPAEIQQMLKKGLYRIAGHGDVNGHQATELRAHLGPFDLDIWVDSQTYQPVRVVKSFNGSLKGHAISFDEAWIARSASLVNLANHPRIPAGFRQVPGPK
jgi:hypothetical protein